MTNYKKLAGKQAQRTSNTVRELVLLKAEILLLPNKDIDFDSTIDYEINIRIPDTDKFKVAPRFSTLLCIEGGSVRNIYTMQFKVMLLKAV